MSSDKIQLPDFLIADLYKNSLVEIENAKENRQIPAQKGNTLSTELMTPQLDSSLKYLGQNEKNIAIILNSNEAAYVNDSDLQFLTNILRACNLHLGDIAIINTDIQPVTFSGLKESLSAKHVLLFGVEPGDIKLPFSIPQFQVQQYAGCTIITAPPLAELNAPTSEGKLIKTKLWVSLQRCFDLPAK
jgi:hypothetical protein